jgi:hypothetical protein
VSLFALWKEGLVAIITNNSLTVQWVRVGTKVLEEVIGRIVWEVDSFNVIALELVAVEP